MNCPPQNTIKDFADGGLSSAALAEVERHLDDCSRCAELVAMAVSSRDVATLPAAGSMGRVLPRDMRLGRYEIRRWIGRGGMADVYEGFDPELDRKVALKLLRAAHHERPSAQRRLSREAKTLARLSSPHVVAALDVGVQADHLFLVMELIQGPTLAAWLEANHPPWRRVLELFLQAGDGLAAAHDVGVIHRDFKPHNVIIGADGKARVSDFGLARAMEANATDSPAQTQEGGSEAGAVAATADPLTLTKTGAVIGTPRYMSPEQFLARPLDARADQFAFCVALFEALYGHHPFTRDQGLPAAAAFDQMRDAVIGGRTVPPARRMGVPRAIAVVLRRGLARNPDDRYPALRDLLTALRRAAHAPRRWIAAGLSGLGLAGAVGAIWLWAGGHGPLSQAPLVVEPQGRPADWSSSRILVSVPDRIHCLGKIADGTLRMIWGKPMRAEDIDVATGTRRPSNLLPETYRHGCPELSPDGRHLIYEGYDQAGRPHIFHSPNRDGRGAQPVVPSAEPTLDSEPLWLDSNTTFVYDPNFRHPAIFSITTRRTTKFGEGEDGRGTLIKSVTRTSDGVNIHVTNETGQGKILTRSFGWPALDLLRRFETSHPNSVRWRSGPSTKLLYSTIADAPNDQLVAFDKAKSVLTSVAISPGRDIVDFLSLDRNFAAFVTTQDRSTVWYREKGGDEKPIPGDGSSNSPSVTADGRVLFVRRRGDSWRIQIFRPADGSVRDLTTGPDDYKVAVLPDGTWLVVRHSRPQKILRCSGLGDDGPPTCQPFVDEYALQLAIAPHGGRVAYLTYNSDSLVVRLVSSRDGKPADLARNVTGCQPLWSSPEKLWISSRESTGFLWTEMDVETRMATGRTAPGSWHCYDRLPDPAQPIPDPLRVDVRQDSDIRLRALP